MIEEDETSHNEDDKEPGANSGPSWFQNTKTTGEYQKMSKQQKLEINHEAMENAQKDLETGKYFDKTKKEIKSE